MPFVKDSLSLLIEAANNDLNANTRETINESAIRASYSHIEEAEYEFTYGAEMVPVIKMNDKYYTEMNFLHPFMKSNNIKTITEALDEVARANRLPVKSVGLLIEAENTVDANIAKAIESGNCKKKESALAKVSKAIGIADKLKKNGYDVKKKKPTKCPECGQINCSCTSKKENCCKK